VPVYYGPPEAVVDYNPASFINCEFSNLEAGLAELNILRFKKLKEFEEQEPKKV
jgi:hypothetical protein